MALLPVLTTLLTTSEAAQATATGAGRGGVRCAG